MQQFHFFVIADAWKNVEVQARSRLQSGCDSLCKVWNGIVCKDESLIKDPNKVVQEVEELCTNHVYLQQMLRVEGNFGTAVVLDLAKIASGWTCSRIASS